MSHARIIPDIAQFIAPLNMNGLQGRMLVAPPSGQRKREILLVLGHHTQLEQWWGLVNVLQDYGKVTTPDMPGFGGMDSFYAIGKPPTLNNFADYLAAFIRLRYKRRRLVIVGVSFGFVVATRMLQRYPDLAKKVDLLVSLGGLMHGDDFLLKPLRRRLVRGLVRIGGTRPVALLMKYLCFNDPVVRVLCPRIAPARRMLATMSPLSTETIVGRESRAWQINDVSSHWRTLSQCLVLDNCKQKVEVPVWSVVPQDDRLLDSAIVEQHVLVVFSSNKTSVVSIKSSDYSQKDNASILLPAGLKKVLAASV